MSDLRYPIGRFQQEEPIPPEQLQAWISDIESLPNRLREAAAGLSEEQLDTPYRPGGWTVRQVIHHVADSHMNSFIRFKLALTEPEPVIKPYREERWAELPDTSRAPIGLSLELLQQLHERWVLLLRSMTEGDYARLFVHPDSGPLTLARTTGLYAWHGRNHTAHIAALRERMSW
ncbi:bacillithiol transferase BstA [Paenibacillus aurantius]|uniref:Putative metal-dependent hydrolase MJA45_22095 n=1 Tax=Paenibacillus aurantius TaxID=2918900 RepID=A0AA96REA3_9BACL|nr:bacillithiol transferase BstA [Paenibacillus aurantius]WNQ10286.1 bacillithiol transferase BstA [Paenibacillus aurantius]